MVDLLAMVETLQPDVIGVTESWGDDEISDGEFSLLGFTMFRRDRASEHRGGGVLLYVRCEFNPIKVTLSSQFVEQVWCSIQIKMVKNYLLVCAIVHPMLPSLDQIMIRCCLTL